MKPDSSKTEYLLLKAINEADGAYVSPERIAKNMLGLSRNVFNTAVYATSKKPIAAKVQRFFINGLIDYSNRRGWKLSKHGINVLTHYNRQYKQPTVSI